MADTQGQADIRDIFIDRLVKGFADEELVFERFVTSGPTSAREIRWVQKTSGFLTSPTTTGFTDDMIETAEGVRPVALAQSWTRNTSYVKMWKAETETISEEDIRDNMVDILGAHLRDVTRAVMKKVNDHIWDILTESQSASDINSVTTTSVGGDQWDAASFAAEIAVDVERAKRLIRTNNYEPSHLFVSPTDYESIVTWLISKGAQAPSIGNSLTSTGQITTLFGLTLVVSNSVTADYAAVAAPKQAVTYRKFMPLRSATIEDPMIGIKVRVAEEGIAMLNDPKAVTLIVDTQT